MSRSVPTTDLDGPPDRKGVLFCPTCEHASTADGDWVVHEHARSLEYRCPDCGARITERTHERERGHEQERPTHPVARLWSTWLRTANAWVRSTRRSRV
ncbi:hypothetical protein [Halalkalicoccus salilacus]|uniref:hypothetical protein n=1 Tax=Halalkalicoccus TaxID=332246 RepID=UPI002F966D07